MKIDPKAAGFSPDRLSRLDEHLQTQYLDSGKIKGCQTLVARRGVIAHFGSLGFADEARGERVSEDTIFRIYSMTKPVTSVALMQLYERGMFQLNDPISRIIPGWKDPKVYVSGEGDQVITEPSRRPITFRHVLSHTAGLSYGNGEHAVDGCYQTAGLGRRSDFTLSEFTTALAGMPLRFHPGEAWLYSYATDVCGYLVEALSGQSFDDYLQSNIFEPLEMADSGFHVPGSKLERFAANYARRPDRSLSLIDDPMKSTYGTPPTFLSGGGGLVSTTKDYFNFCEMLRQRGQFKGRRLLSPRTLEMMTLNHLGADQDLSRMALGSFSETAYEGIGFGLGFAMNLGEVASGQIGDGDFYWGGAASTIFSVDPREELVIIFMTQLMPSSTFNFRGQLKNIVYGALDH